MEKATKKISFLKTAVSFSGCFLGAGYVSGQELYQFFSSFGNWGVAGLACAILLVVLFGMIVFKIVQKTGELQIDKVICGERFKILRRIIAFLEIFFLFGIFVIMTSGAGALMSDMFGINYYIATALFCAISIPAMLSGVGGMVAVFSMVVPLLSVFVCLIALYVLKDANGISFEALKSQNTNVLLNNWAFSAITYVSYNMFAAIPIMIPLANVSKKGRVSTFACVLGGVILLAIAISINICMASYADCVSSELPMFEMLKSISFYVSVIYGILLMCAMFSAGVSSVISVEEYIKDKYLKNSNNKYIMVLITLIIVLLAWFASSFGFANLVGTVYPICGYFGFVVLIFLCYRCLKLIKKDDGYDNKRTCKN